MKLRFKTLARAATPPAHDPHRGRPPLQLPPRPQRARGGAVDHRAPYRPRGAEEHASAAADPQTRARLLLQANGFDRPTEAQIYHVARIFVRGGSPEQIHAAVMQARAMHGGTHARAVPEGHPRQLAGDPASQAALDLAHRAASALAGRHAYARGGAIDPVTAAFAAMKARPHFDDGGDAGGDSSHSSTGGSSSGEGGSGGNDNSSSSSSTSGDSSNSDHSSTSADGGFSSGAASGADSATGSNSTSGGQSDASTGATNGTSGGLGGAVGGASSSEQSDAATSGGYGSATSGPVGSIAGSVGAPAAGGFSNEGAAATGGFGSFGATPTATSNLGGFTNATPTASSLSGQTAQQSMAAQAASSGDPGEDGTGSLSNVTANGAFGSFGPSPASPYGSTANAQAAFSGTQASDLAGSSLSPAGQALGAMGLGAMPAGLAQNPNGFASPGAYGLSTATGGLTPGFDNFSSSGNLGTSAGVVQSSSLGAQGYTGAEADSPNDMMSTLQGNMPGSLVNAMYSNIPGADSMATDVNDLANSFKAAGLPFDGMAPNATAYGPNPAAATPGTAQPTGTTLGLNADGDPTAVGGVSALTIHGNQTEAAQGAYDAPGPVTGTFGGITDKQAFTARQNIASGAGTAADQAIASGYTAQQNSPVTRTAGIGLGAAPAAQGNSASGSEPGAPSAASGVTSGGPSGSAGAPTAAPDASDPASQPGQPPSLTIAGVPTGAYYTGLHNIEGGVLNHQVDPNNPTHYGPAQFTQQTFDGVARNNPQLGVTPGTSMYSVSPETYANFTVALTRENATALQNAGLPATPANLYMVHNLGAPVGIAALKAGPDATLAQAGIPASYIASNPSIYVRLRREPRKRCLRFPARRDRGRRWRGRGQGCPDQAAASRSAAAEVGFQFHGSSSARRWAGWDAMRPSTSASQA